MLLQARPSREIKMNLQSFIDVVRTLATQSWFPGSSGNVSIIDRPTKLLYIKETGKPAALLNFDDIVITDLDGKVIVGGKPSKEINLHLGIYRTRPEMSVVIHGHPPYSTAYAIKGVSPLVTGPAKLYLKKIPIVEVAPSGSLELAAYVSEAFGDPEVKVCLMKNHGVVCAGKDIYDAYVQATWLEDNSQASIILNNLR